MRRFLVPATFVCALTLAGAPTASSQVATADTMAMLPPDWTRVAFTEDFVVEVHPLRLTSDANGIIRGWERTKFNAPQKTAEGKAYVQTMVQKRYDCEQRRSLAIRGIFYNRSGEVGGSWTAPSYDQEWKDVVPESVGEGVLDEVCAYFGR
jgi:hypothetical protein